MKISHSIIVPLILLTYGCAPKNSEMSTLNSPPESNQSQDTYIPKDINDCFAELMRILPPDDIKEIKQSREDDLVKYHFGLGQWIRNNWGLWGNSRLKDYFVEMGFRHPDDMSSAIVDSFWQHLNGIPVDIKKQAQASEYYWQVHEEPKKPRCPTHNVPIEIMYRLTGFIMEGNQSLPRCIYVGRCSKKKEIWVYEFGKGWHLPEGNIMKRIDELRDEAEDGLIEAPIGEP